MSEDAIDALERLCRGGMARRLDAELLRACLAAPFGDDLEEARAAVWRGRGVFAISSDIPPRISIDGRSAQPMHRTPATRLWYRRARLRAGRTHRFEIFAGRERVADSDVAGYGALSHPLPNAHRGRLLGPFMLRSRIYPGSEVTYRLYETAGVERGTPAPYMVWMDGSYFAAAADLLGYRLAIVSDNLVHLGCLPPMVHVLVDPADGIRSRQYDTVSDRFAVHVFDEVIRDAQQRVLLRDDPYSVGAGGESSGAAAAFGLAWFRPDRVSRIHAGCGSFTGLEGAGAPEPTGAFLYSHLVRRERRNIRVWMSDGARDLNHGGDGTPFAIAGSWPLANIALADSLLRSGYDAVFRFGAAGHNGAQGALDLPESLAWLWRGYRADRTEERFGGAPAPGLQIGLR